MNKNEKASISLSKIIGISIILVFILGIGVMASNAKLTNVKIILSNNYEMTVITSKTKVAEILEENHITLTEEEISIPEMENEISENKTIRIVNKAEQNQEIVETEKAITTEEILSSYSVITEKIVTEQVVIPYETITKESVNGEGNTQNKIIQNGKDGLKEVTYKIKYQNEVEIEKIEISSKIIKEPVNKIVEVKTLQVTSRSMQERANQEEKKENPALTASTALAKKAQGITPTVKTFNTTAYCACAKCCGKTSGTTASGAKPTEWYTVAAGSNYKLGTIIYIPALKDKPNGGWFVVQDRGGAISSTKLDIYMGSHASAINYGRKNNLQAYVYEF